MHQLWCFRQEKAEIGSLSSFNCDVKYLFGLNFWRIKKAKKVLDGFIGIVNEFKRKTNKFWVEKGR